MIRLFVSVAIIGLAASAANGQSRPPVIDMHVHTASIEQLNALNIRYVFLAGSTSELRSWASVDQRRFLPALVFPCDGNRLPIGGTPCLDTPTTFPDVTWLRAELQAGHVKGLGEIVAQYMGLSPGDARLEPYWQLAEEFDVPVGIHMGPGPPPGLIEAGRVKFLPSTYQMSAGDPLLLEEVLLRHPKLRVFVMHAGWPRLDSILALLWAHPTVYVDVSALQGRAIPREAYYRYLREMVTTGFEKRIMFGSDLADQVESGIDAILGAPFLSADQKADILCHNAARFLRLEQQTCEP